MNRFTNLSGHGLQLPLMQLPYEQLDEILGQKKQQLDLFEASSNLTPKFIQESEDDRLLAGQIMKYQQDVKSQLAEIAKTGNVNAYMEGLNQAQNQIKRLYSPGGAADVLQQRYNQKEARDKQIDEFYKTNPKLATYYKQTTPYNKVGYNSQTGEYQPINSFGNVKPHVDEKDINTWFNTNLDNVKDELLKQVDPRQVPKHKLDAITTIHDFWQLEGVSKDKLTNVFLTLFPKEFQDSLYQEETANKYFSGDTTPVDAEWFKKNDKGELELNLNNPVARRIEGYSTLGSRQNLKHDRVKDDNEYLLKEWDLQNSRKLMKEKHELENPFVPPTTGYTETTSNPFFNDIDEIKFKDGKPIAKNRLNEIIPEPQIIYGDDKYGTYTKRYSTSEINDKELDIIDGIKQRHKDLYGKDMTDAQLEKSYNALVQDRKSIKTMYNQYNDNKQKKNRTEVVLGDEKSLLNAGSRPMYVLSPNGVIEPKSVDQIIDLLGTDILGKGIEGEINPDNPFGTPTGDYATAVTKDGRQVSIIIGNRSIEEDSYMSAANQMAKSKYSLKPETIIVRDAQGRPTGAKLRSIPIIQTNENGDYQGVDANIEIYDEKQNFIGTKPLSEYIQEKKALNPYSNK